MRTLQTGKASSRKERWLQKKKEKKKANPSTEAFNGREQSGTVQEAMGAEEEEEERLPEPGLEGKNG